MSSRRKRKSSRYGNPANRPAAVGVDPRLPSDMREWQPLEQYEQNPEAIAIALVNNTRPAIAIFGNDLYDISVYMIGEDTVGDGPHPDPDMMYHISLKRRDRHVVHDWRHLQAIKNEIFGPERMAFEIYPPESKLVDTANQYHLWVLPESFELPFGFDEQLLSSDYQVEEFNEARRRGEHKGRQRPFQPGLPVAEGRNTKPDAMAPQSGILGTMRSKVPGG